jgi:hypothetical protein
VLSIRAVGHFRYIRGEQYHMHLLRPSLILGFSKVVTAVQGATPITRVGRAERVTRPSSLSYCAPSTPELAFECLT